MATEQQQYKLAGLTVEHQAEFRHWSNQDAQWAIQNTIEAMALWREAIKCRTDKALAQAESRIDALAVHIPVSAVAECDIKNLFHGMHIAHRDNSLDRWMKESVPAFRGGSGSSYSLRFSMNFAEVLAEYLGGNEELEVFTYRLLKQAKCFSPMQVDGIIMACERGVNPFQLRTDGRANLFPVFDGASMFFLYTGRRSNGWDVYVYKLDDDSRWIAECAVIFRN